MRDAVPLATKVTVLMERDTQCGGQRLSVEGTFLRRSLLNKTRGFRTGIIAELTIPSEECVDEGRNS